MSALVSTKVMKALELLKKEAKLKHVHYELSIWAQHFNPPKSSIWFHGFYLFTTHNSLEVAKQVQRNLFKLESCPNLEHTPNCT